MFFELVMLSNHLILGRPLLLLPSVFPNIRVFSNEWVLHIRLPKYWSFNFSNSPSNEYSGLISFSIDWLDLLGVQGTLKSLLQHHNSKAAILWCSVVLRYQFDPWAGKIPWRRAWQPTPVFLPGESHGQRSLKTFCYQMIWKCLGSDQASCLKPLLSPWAREDW